MVRKTNKQWLYLVKVEPRTVAIIPAKDLYDAINKYITKAGFDGIREYFCSYLMTNTIEINAGTNSINEYGFITTGIKTIDDDYYLRINSQQVRSCDDIFERIDLRDINSPLFMKPTIEEVRNCIGFSREPMYQLRKFCM